MLTCQIARLSPCPYHFTIFYHHHRYLTQRGKRNLFSLCSEMGFQFRNVHHSQFSQPLTKPSWVRNFATRLLEKSALNSSVPGFSVLDSTLFLLLVQIWSMQRAWLGTWKPDQPSGHIGHIGQCQVGSCTFGTFKASLHCATDPPPWPQVFSLSRSSSSQQSSFIQAGGSQPISTSPAN